MVDKTESDDQVREIIKCPSSWFKAFMQTMHEIRRKGDVEEEG